MILIVADTGPINYLIQIGHIDLLAALVDTTVLPASVAAELRHARAPDAVRAWAAAPPGWVQIRSATELVNADDLSVADREAIALAKELHASVLLMDDQQARRAQRSVRWGIRSGGFHGLQACLRRDTEIRSKR
jgi:predicted nucleic acid-binding protein